MPPPPQDLRSFRFPSALGAEEVVEPLDLVDVLPEEGVPRRVVARALGERTAVPRLPLLDVADVARDAGQVLRSGLAEYQKSYSAAVKGGLPWLASLDLIHESNFEPLAM